jgi:imidazolonepropionase-like amidohydrolase
VRSQFWCAVAAHQAFVIPTLTVLHSICGTTPSGRELISGPHLRPFLTRGNVANLKETFPWDSRLVSCAGAGKAIKQLKAAGVPILAGTDAPNPGTTYGASLHEELVLLVEAGLTPTEALIAATSAPALAFHASDRGRIARGLRADLVLVNGNPTEDILATRNIVAVYKGGIEDDRDEIGW